MDLHRHDEYSTFDGFGKAKELAILAKEKGHTALGISNHGSINGLVQHYFDCKEVGIKPIMGVEAYFQPKLNKEKPRYHLCLFVKDLKGYENLNKLQLIAEKQKYYKPIITFKDLKEHSEGLICTSACLAGYIPSLLMEENYKLANKALDAFVKIFGDDFYLEIQPYEVGEGNNDKQKIVNQKIIELAFENDIKCILTSDSHYGDKKLFDTYLKMHEITGTKYDVKATYGERYMPTDEELMKRFYKMHKNDNYDFDFDAKKFAKQCIKNLKEIEDKVEDEILEKLEIVLPEYIEGKNSYKLLEKKVRAGLKKRGKYTKEYIDRCKKELEVIEHHGFADYFLIVADYVQWAKNNGIAVGPGRGSVCNCQVAWALGITEVDSLFFGLDFRRFLRLDKKKMPDIDLDFQTTRRHEVIDYIINKYKGHAAQICSYGLYKVDNLINDLAKVCGMDDPYEIKSLKKYIKENIVEDAFDYEAIKNKKRTIEYNENYDNIILHFSRMYLKVRYIGTHAAGVAVTGGNLLRYTGLKYDSKTGKLFTVYDLADLERINVVKFDILGLNTIEQIQELENLTGDKICEEWFNDEKIYENFRKGNTDGVFQFEKQAVKDILAEIECDCFEDLVAASSMNRPGPLSLGMHTQYAESKQNQDMAKKLKYYPYTKETYGTIVYQEQLQQICVNIGKMSWEDTDRVMKILKGTSATEAVRLRHEREKGELTEKFVAGAIENGYTKKEAEELFEKFLVYTFNKGHGVGYTIISLQEMYYKLYHPLEYWYVKCKYAPKESDLFKYKAQAALSGIILFIPHVNYSADFSLRKVDGELVIQEGLSSIKFVGEKAAQFIEAERRQNGFYKSVDDFINRCQVKGSGVNKRVIEQLLEHGALEFDKKTYINRVIKYNSTLYMKGGK